jgi:hypothetical protein
MSIHVHNFENGKFHDFEPELTYTTEQLKKIEHIAQKIFEHLPELDKAVVYKHIQRMILEGDV